MISRAVGISVCGILFACAPSPKPAVHETSRQAAPPQAPPPVAPAPAPEPTPPAPVPPRPEPEPAPAAIVETGPPSWCTERPVRSGGALRLCASATGATVTEARAAALRAGRASLERELGNAANASIERTAIVREQAGFRIYILLVSE